MQKKWFHHFLLQAFLLQAIQHLCLIDKKGFAILATAQVRITSLISQKEKKFVRTKKSKFNNIEVNTDLFGQKCNGLTYDQ